MGTVSYMYTYVAVVCVSVSIIRTSSFNAGGFVQKTASF